MMLGMIWVMVLEWFLLIFGGDFGMILYNDFCMILE